VAVLGPLEVRDDGHVVDISGAKQRAVVAILATNAGRVVSGDRLIEELWGDDAPVDAANALQHHISRLRRVLGPERLVARPPGYVLELDEDAVDAIAFERLTAEGRAALRAGDQHRADETLREALSLWRGEPLAEFADQRWSLAEAARLERLHDDAIEDRVEVDLALGRHADVVPELEAIVEERPFRERAWGHLMLALYRAGRQADALDAYRRAREALADVHGLDPSPDLQRLEARILAQDPTLSALPPSASERPAERDRGNLPAPLTTLVGRQDELVELARVLERSRLVSLTGPAGAGKTRLAVELGRRVVDRHRDGVWLVELGRVTDPADVAGTVASVLDAGGVGVATSAGIPRMGSPADRTDERLRGSDAVLILDNCEHLLAPASELARSVLERHEGVKILATSREPLGVPGEVRWPVPTLSVPSRATRDVRDLLGSEAVRLFVDRAKAAKPSFELTAENAASVVELCRSLDGLPLALELAAARVSALPVAAIAGALRDRFALLTTGSRSGPLRQQTLRAAVEWSYELLEDRERALFRACSVFPGGVSIDTAVWIGERTAIGSDGMLALLTALVDKSMLVAGTGPGIEPRYGMLETLRAYGLDVLRERGEEPAATRALADFALRLAEMGDDGLRGRDHARWLRLLDLEFDNLRKGFDETIRSGDAEAALRIAAAVGWYFAMTDRHGHDEGRAWMDEALALPQEDVARPVRAHALAILSYLAGQQLDVEAAVAAGEQAVAMARGVSRTRAFALANMALAMALAQAGRPEGVPGLVGAGSDAYRDIGDEWGIAQAELVLAPTDMRAGDVERVAERARAVIESGRRSGYDPWEIWGRLLLAWADERTGSTSAARREYERTLERSTALGFDLYVSFVLVQLGRLALVDGEVESALDLDRRAVELADAVGSAWFAAVARNALGLALERSGDTEGAERAHRAVVEALAGDGRPYVRETFFVVLNGDPVARSLVALGEIAERRGLLEEAETSARAALDRAKREHDAPTVAAAVETLGRLSTA
jgi:predicted ATPase/DNA-binding SARP family transcriptional activator